VRGYLGGGRGVVYDPGWMNAYFKPQGYLENFKSYHENLETERMKRASRDGNYTTGGSFVEAIGEEPSVAPWYRMVNEWVLLNQVTVYSGWYSSLIIFCIILAGILVGVHR
jgi:hypothetical protein